MVKRSRLRTIAQKPNRRMRLSRIKFPQITEEEYNRRTVPFKELKVVNYYSDVTPIALEGKKNWSLRTNESDASPENRDVDTTKKITMYTAVNPDLHEGEFGRWVAIATIDGKRGMVVHQGNTKKEVANRLVFDRVYSMYAPSIMWRTYRFLQGWKF